MVGAGESLRGFPPIAASTQGGHGAGGFIASRVAADVTAVRTGNEGLASMWAAREAGARGSEAVDVEMARAASGAATRGFEAPGVKAAGTAGGAEAGG